MKKTIMCGEEVLMPYLLDRKILSIDYVIISHFDTDHVEGILYVMNNMKVKNAIITKQPESSENFKEFIKIANEKNVNVKVVQKSDKIFIEKGLYFDVLWPDSSNFLDENRLNNNALVCKLNYKNFSCLFTGDIEKIAEEQIISLYKENPDILKSTVLKIPHHGSKSSSTQEFLELIKPKVALIGVGKNNRYGHPASQTISRLKDLRIQYI